MKLDSRTLALIAVGASVSANCRPCLERNIEAATRCGADQNQIGEAIDIGRRVRRGAASKLDEFASKFNYARGISPDRAIVPCECSE